MEKNSKVLLVLSGKLVHCSSYMKLISLILEKLVATRGGDFLILAPASVFGRLRTTFKNKCIQLDCSGRHALPGKDKIVISNVCKEHEIDVVHVYGFSEALKIFPLIKDLGLRMLVTCLRSCFQGMIADTVDSEFFKYPDSFIVHSDTVAKEMEYLGIPVGKTEVIAHLDYYVAHVSGERVANMSLKLLPGMWDSRSVNIFLIYDVFWKQTVDFFIKVISLIKASKGLDDKIFILLDRGLDGSKAKFVHSELCRFQLDGFSYITTSSDVTATYKLASSVIIPGAMDVQSAEDLLTVVAMKKPVIVSDRNISADVINHGRNGWVYRERSFCDCAKYILKSNNLVESGSDSIQEAIESNFSSFPKFSHVGNRILDIYLRK